MTKYILSLLMLMGLSACSVGKLPTNLSRSVLNQDSPELVKQGLPSYLILLDALVLTYPEDDSFLFSAAKLNAAYAGSFADNPKQAKSMAKKALSYAQRGLCEEEKSLCKIQTFSSEKISQELKKLDEDELPAVYAFASSWLSYIQTHSNDWSAIANLSKAKLLMQWVVDTKPKHDKGMPYVYLGVIESQFPPALGGKPDLAKAHFEKAFEYSSNKNLISKVYYAKFYARLMFNQTLHDELLKQVIKAEPKHEGLTLMNVLAQEQAQVLLNDSPNYFE